MSISNTSCLSSDQELLFTDVGIVILVIKFTRNNRSVPAGKAKQGCAVRTIYTSDTVYVSAHNIFSQIQGQDSFIVRTGITKKIIIGITKRAGSTGCCRMQRKTT